MVSLRKKSKRQTTRLRAKIEKRVNAHNRKQRKLSKKDGQWKSRYPKDPGIPNNFPDKEKILLQLQSQVANLQGNKSRRQLESRQDIKVSNDNEIGSSSEEIETLDSMSSEMVHVDDSNQQNMVDIPSIQTQSQSERKSVLEAFLNSAQKREADWKIKEDSDSNLVETSSKEKSRKQFNQDFEKILVKSDVLIYVLDARDPNKTRSKAVEQKVLANPNKRLLLVMNKADLVPSNVLKGWILELCKIALTIPFMATNGVSKKFDHVFLSKNTAAHLISALKGYASKMNFKRSLSVGIVGYPNVGKSSIINTLISRNVKKQPCTAGSEAGLTNSLQLVKLDNKLKLIDCPGIVFPEEENMKCSHSISDLAMLGAVPLQKIQNPLAAAEAIVTKILQSPELTDATRNFYSIPPILNISKEAAVNDLLVNIARKRGRIGKGGIPLKAQAAIMLISDWCNGRILWWTDPPSKTSIEISDVKKIVASFSKEFDVDGLLLEDAMDQD